MTISGNARSAAVVCCLWLSARRLRGTSFIGDCAGNASSRLVLSKNQTRAGVSIQLTQVNVLPALRHCLEPSTFFRACFYFTMSNSARPL
jgi:hypothetical protein